jgi:hypothetical protein
MKKCTKCNIEKDESEFVKNKAKKSGIGHQCLECQRLYFRRYWANNKESQKPYIKNRKKKLVEDFYEYKKTLKCSRCGFNEHPSALDFHHIEDNKEFDIGKMAGHGYSFKRIKEEIDKCIVLCANCHRIHHHT